MRETNAMLDRERLIQRIAAGERFEYVYFWGHRVAADGSITKSCFSQWYPAPFEVDGARYATAEHYMMAGKARIFSDAEAVEAILASDDPAEAKRLGRKVRGFDEATWRAQRLELVVAGNVAKFTQHAAMGEVLRNTAPAVIVEAAPRDVIWGIGLSANSERAADPTRWRGRNLLGFALMEVRRRLFAR